MAPLRSIALLLVAAAASFAAASAEPALREAAEPALREASRDQSRGWKKKGGYKGGYKSGYKGGYKGGHTGAQPPPRLYFFVFAAFMLAQRALPSLPFCPRALRVFCSPNYSSLIFLQNSRRNRALL
jgi:hypothetical protein